MPAKYTPEMQIEAFWRKIKIGEGEFDCWEWQASTVRGYGCIRVNYKLFYSHRFVFELAIGEIPDGLHVCHHCDNRKCCNPNHLFLGTNLDNIVDRVEKDRSARAENHTACKFPSATIQEMRERYNDNPFLGAQKEISEEFQISKGHLSQVLSKQKRKRG